MSLSPLEYLRHILVETESLRGQTKHLGKSQFLENETFQRAFVRSLEIIGEATKKIPPEFKQQYSHSKPTPMGTRGMERQ